MSTPLISAPDLSRLLLEDPLLLDCRFDLFNPEKGKEDYLEAHIPRAHYLHLNDDLSGDIVPGKTGRHPLPEPKEFVNKLTAIGFTAGQPVVAYDDKGGGIAARAWWMLMALGYENVSVLDGGFPAWLAAGLSTTSGTETFVGTVPELPAPPTFPGTREPRRGECPA